VAGVSGRATGGPGRRGMSKKTLGTIPERMGWGSSE